MASFRTYTTSQLAEAADVGPQTLRYYERRGLLPEPPRTGGGHRIYGSTHLERLLFIQRAQSLGFSLREVQQMLALGTSSSADAPSLSVCDLLAAIDAKLDALHALRATLRELDTHRQAPDHNGNGPLVGALVGGAVLHGGD